MRGSVRGPCVFLNLFYLLDRGQHACYPNVGIILFLPHRMSPYMNYIAVFISLITSYALGFTRYDSLFSSAIYALTVPSAN